MSDSATPWTAAHQASLSLTISWRLLKLMSIESLMPSNHLIICHPLLLLPSNFPIIRVFSNESAHCIRRPKEVGGDGNLRKWEQGPLSLMFRVSLFELPSPH